ncbi:hypothetical protein THAOC_24650 [Thalassiosira oceanica]|uniref:Uncharacterized protein n=1 Tax=Thalassiosira oceanica TaxID=159749 RepID=K0RRE0_THAOC|nr:hypothetical protein THAOC_24650 [Thalassiosira oceanica]|eukprot:EJK55605.1 hypothetical protein THAOC_24650 [Thalassiosira oceanica]
MASTTISGANTGGSRGAQPTSATGSGGGSTQPTNAAGGGVGATQSADTTTNNMSEAELKTMFLADSALYEGDYADEVWEAAQLEIRTLEEEEKTAMEEDEETSTLQPNAEGGAICERNADVGVYRVLRVIEIEA